MQADVGLIGGTGIGVRLGRLGGESVHVPTSFGCVRGRLIEHEGQRLFALSRHAAGHTVPPHRVTYLAIADALRRLQARACFSTAAVGSLRADWAPGTLAVATDFFDAAARNLTAHDHFVQHVDFSEPFPASAWLNRALDGLGVTAERAAVYVNANGPRYETPAEVRAFRAWGGDVAGMTAGSEAVAMRELGVAYGCLCVVTNLGTGLAHTGLSHEDVGEVMGSVGEVAVRVLLEAARLVGGGR